MGRTQVGGRTFQKQYMVEKLSLVGPQREREGNFINSENKRGKIRRERWPLWKGQRGRPDKPLQRTAFSSRPKPWAVSLRSLSTKEGHVIQLSLAHWHGHMKSCYMRKFQNLELGIDLAQPWSLHDGFAGSICERGGFRGTFSFHG